MNIEEKMSCVLNKVLDDNEYKVDILNDNYYIVYHGKKVVQETETTSSISAHWRLMINKIISMIINERIKSALNEV